MLKKRLLYCLIRNIAEPLFFFCNQPVNSPLLSCSRFISGAGRATSWAGGGQGVREAVKETLQRMTYVCYEVGRLAPTNFWEAETIQQSEILARGAEVWRSDDQDQDQDATLVKAKKRRTPTK
mmetsp:Transcript_18408/g.39333  ORF Transcript_18408/g.39333 Transcript_18408/m.39333 type:complete len:123 (+) Transcript_18408:2606-2974(+)